MHAVPIALYSITRLPCACPSREPRPGGPSSVLPSPPAMPLHLSSVVSDDLVGEICRCAAGELHVVAAVVGAIAAQVGGPACAGAVHTCCVPVRRQLLDRALLHCLPALCAAAATCHSSAAAPRGLNGPVHRLPTHPTPNLHLSSTGGHQADYLPVYTRGRRAHLQRHGLNHLCVCILSGGRGGSSSTARRGGNPG